MDAAGFRALNIRCSPVNLLRPIRPASLSETIRRSKPSPVPKPYCASLALLSTAPSPSPSCSLERGDPNSNSNGSVSSASEVASSKLLQVVLVSPQIPGNTGAIARTCAASAVGLHLVGPLGYKIEDSKLKRAGLDYWPYVVVKIHESWAEFRDYFKQQSGEKRLLAFTKRGTSIHSDVSYKQGDWLVFGSETCGLPPEALEDCCTEGFGGGTIRIPMVETYVRCLNLSVSVGIALYEAARQLNYEQLQLSSESGTERLFLTEDIYG
ncbi:uncharacterized protein [Typha latifolia]|uniref:uncharacterized protein n=1 Tax=Typha latifolia TaxID=4733 RepID=UPI003C2B06AE